MGGGSLEVLLFPDNKIKNWFDYNENEQIKQTIQARSSPTFFTL